TSIFSRGGPRTNGLWRWLPRSLFHRTAINFGPPIVCRDLLDIENNKARIQAINKRIIERIEELKTDSPRV
ncbi:MAG: hypothetical protein U9N73_12245, partial [Candidatus Auribacterota bacterium]|nr:hypothetical protein [Candidatus Auribacterota bacterium]